jgi:hypothetical protein
MTESRDVLSLEPGRASSTHMYSYRRAQLLPAPTAINFGEAG